MASVAQVVVADVVELVSGMVGPTETAASPEPFEEAHPASAPAARPVAAAMETMRRATQPRPDSGAGLLTSGGRCRSRK